MAAQAASVQEAADLLQGQDAAASTAGSSTLDRALSVDTNAGQRNLDLLLETRTAADVPADGRARRATALPLQTRSSAATAALSSLPAVDDSTGMPGTGAQRDWLGGLPGGTGGAGLLGMSGGVESAGVDLGLHRGGGGAAHEMGPLLRGEFVREVLQFLRDHRNWLLGGLALVALVAAGVQVWLRRAAATPESRAQRLAEARVGRGLADGSGRRTRRRSSHRA